MLVFRCRSVIPIFTKILPAKAVLLHVDWQTNRQTCMRKLIAAY